MATNHKLIEQAIICSYRGKRCPTCDEGKCGYFPDGNPFKSRKCDKKDDPVPDHD